MTGVFDKFAIFSLALTGLSISVSPHPMILIFTYIIHECGHIFFAKICGAGLKKFKIGVINVFLPNHANNEVKNKINDIDEKILFCALKQTKGVKCCENGFYFYDQRFRKPTNETINVVINNKLTLHKIKSKLDELNLKINEEFENVREYIKRGNAHQLECFDDYIRVFDTGMSHPENELKCELYKNGYYKNISLGFLYNAIP